MIVKTNWSVSKEKIEECVNLISKTEIKLPLNFPVGNFFYDKWEIKKEYADTVWHEILNSLPCDHGEARLIRLDPGSNYHCHSDIDDRWHLSITGSHSFLLDLSDEQMYKLDNDGFWYHMDAGKLHSAANFGQVPRIQLVVRQLLKRQKLIDPLRIKIASNLPPDEVRFKFDQAASQWLNKANKEGHITDFEFSNRNINVSVEKSKLYQLLNLLDNDFKVVFL